MLLNAKFYLQRARRGLYFKTILGPEKLLHVYKDLSTIISNRLTGTHIHTWLQQKQTNPRSAEEIMSHVN